MIARPAAATSARASSWSPPPHPRRTSILSASDQSIPHEDVKPVDLLDQEHDRPARSCNLRARLVLESTAPPTQDLELLGVRSVNPTRGREAGRSPRSRA